MEEEIYGVFVVWIRIFVLICPRLTRRPGFIIRIPAKLFAVTIPGAGNRSFAIGIEVQVRNYHCLGTNGGCKDGRVVLISVGSFSSHSGR